MASVVTEDVRCKFFIGSSKMRLSDKNEWYKYLGTVFDDEVERCQVETRDREVDCPALCCGGLRGVEFKSYTKGVDLEGMRRELSRKRVLGDECTTCVLVILVSQEDSTYLLERAESVVKQNRASVVDSVHELAEKICNGKIVLWVVGGVGACCDHDGGGR